MNADTAEMLDGIGYWIELPCWPWPPHDSEDIKKIVHCWRWEKTKIEKRLFLQTEITRFESELPIVPSVCEEVKSVILVAQRIALSERIEAFVTYLLHLLFLRGDVVKYGWYAMYENGTGYIDSLGVDQWCVLAPRHGGVFCFIDTKTVLPRIRDQQNGWRGGIVFPYCPGVDPRDGIAAEKVTALSQELLNALIAFFGNNGNKENSYKNGKAPGL